MTSSQWKAAIRWFGIASGIALAGLFAWSGLWSSAPQPRWQVFANGWCACFFVLGAIANWRELARMKEGA